MAEYFANVIARLIVSYLTLLIISLVILAGYWIIEDCNAMVEFVESISDNAFAEFIVWMPLIFAWFKPDRRGNATEILNARMRHAGMRCSMSGRW
ncbi:MAG TPA: hypothetical protein VLZ29_02655 [Sulfurimonas sp.]|uniref:hypothetical protein n=1 Tax=Sulfurimonas sp. TaxID=2022749 RepID=UPI002C7174CE|nr:hypothetical protein [Sulfurimonas sp.]HUH41995.1 hypothetical protein [Sulfurimonas sp.]